MEESKNFIKEILNEDINDRKIVCEIDDEKLLKGYLQALLLNIEGTKLSKKMKDFYFEKIILMLDVAFGCNIYYINNKNIVIEELYNNKINYTNYGIKKCYELIKNDYEKTIMMMNKENIILKDLNDLTIKIHTEIKENNINNQYINNNSKKRHLQRSTK